MVSLCTRVGSRRLRSLKAETLRPDAVGSSTEAVSFGGVTVAIGV